MAKKEELVIHPFDAYFLTESSSPEWARFIERIYFRTPLPSIPPGWLLHELPQSITLREMGGTGEPGSFCHQNKPDAAERDAIELLRGFRPFRYLPKHELSTGWDPPQERYRVDGYHVLQLPGGVEFRCYFDNGYVESAYHLPTKTTFCEAPRGEWRAFPDDWEGLRNFSDKASDLIQEGYPW